MEKIKKEEGSDISQKVGVFGYLGISEEQGLVEQWMDVSDGRVVHKKAQAGLEVASNHWDRETKTTHRNQVP